MKYTFSDFSGHKILYKARRFVVMVALSECAIRSANHHIISRGEDTKNGVVVRGGHRLIVPLTRDHVTHSAPRIRNITFAPWNHMNVTMRHGLSRNLATVHSDVEAFYRAV